ncbi:hypothetical protein Hanom_Chr16g01456951 [Helianthus anomalus]
MRFLPSTHPMSFFTLPHANHFLTCDIQFSTCDSTHPMLFFTLPHASHFFTCDIQFSTCDSIHPMSFFTLPHASHFFTCDIQSSTCDSTHPMPFFTLPNAIFSHVIFKSSICDFVHLHTPCHFSHYPMLIIFSHAICIEFASDLHLIERLGLSRTYRTISAFVFYSLPIYISDIFDKINTTNVYSVGP